MLEAARSVREDFDGCDDTVTLREDIGDFFLRQIKTKQVGGVKNE